MRYSKIAAALLLLTSQALAHENSNTLALSCDDFEWKDVETLVQPYLDDVLLTALVMQAQSSEYNVSAAASQAMDKSLPAPIQRILQALIDADC